MLDDADEDIGLSTRTGCIGSDEKTGNESEVRYALQHECSPGPTFPDIDNLIINRQASVTDRVDVQTRSSDNDIRINVFTFRSEDTGGVDGFNSIGDNLGIGFTKGIEEFSILGEDHSLFPGLVTWFEVFVDGVVYAELLEDTLSEEFRAEGRETAHDEDEDVFGY